VRGVRPAVCPRNAINIDVRTSLDRKTAQLPLQTAMREGWAVGFIVWTWGDRSRLKCEVLSMAVSSFGEGCTSLVVWNVALAGIRKVWEDSSDSLCRGGFAGGDGDKEFDEVVVYSTATGLDHKYVFASN